jgi:hypothetical protein
LPIKSRAAWATFLGLWALALWLPRSPGLTPGKGHPNWPPQNFACYYGRWDRAHLKAAAQFQLLMVHPGKRLEAFNQELVRHLRSGQDGILGSPDDPLVLAYLSLGEDEDPPRGQIVPWLVDSQRYQLENGFPRNGEDGLWQVQGPGQDGIPDRNGAWGSYYVQPDHPLWWQKLEARTSKLSQIGVDGFLLDTVDVQPQFQPAMLKLVQRLRSRWPKHYLVANRGLDLLGPSYAASLDGMLLESLFSQWDWYQQKGVLSPYLQDNLKRLEQLKAYPKLQLFYLDYLDPEQSDRGYLLAHRGRRSPAFWSHPFLDRLSLGPEPMDSGPQLEPPNPGPARRNEDGFVQLELPPNCELRQWPGGAHIAWKGGTIAAGSCRALEVRSYLPDGRASQWKQIELPEMAEGDCENWSMREIHRGLEVSWEGGGSARLWQGPLNLLQPVAGGPSPLRVEKQSEQLSWVCLQREGLPPSLARPFRARSCSVPPAPQQVTWQRVGQRLRVQWQSQPAAVHRIYLGDPPRLPFEATEPNFWEGPVAEVVEPIRVTAVDSDNHQSQPSIAQKK